MTPAEKLAAKKPKRKPNSRHGKLHCRLRELRQRAGLNQRDAAKAVGITQCSLSIIENGGGLSLTKALALAIFYDTDPREIWKAKR